MLNLTPLDCFRLLFASEVLARHSLTDVRLRSLANLARWRRVGIWCAGYGRWEELLSHGDDASVEAAMSERDPASVALRRWMPYAGLLPADVVETLRLRAGAGVEAQMVQGPERYTVTVMPAGPNENSVSIGVVDELTGRHLGASGSHFGAPKLIGVLIEDHRERREAGPPSAGT